MVTVEETLEAVAQERMEIALQYIKTPTWKKKRKRTDTKMGGRMVKQVQVTVNRQQLELEVHLTFEQINHNDRVLSEISQAMSILSRNQKKISSHPG